MRRIPTLSAALLAAAIVLAGTGCSYLKSRDHLNQSLSRSTEWLTSPTHEIRAVEAALSRSLTTASRRARGWLYRSAPL